MTDTIQKIAEEMAARASKLASEAGDGDHLLQVIGREVAETVNGWADRLRALSARASAGEGGEDEHVRLLVGKLDQWRMCMSHNQSYFGEPAGLMKATIAELAKAVDPIYPPKPEPVDPLAGVEIHTATFPLTASPTPQEAAPVRVANVPTCPAIDADKPNDPDYKRIAALADWIDVLAPGRSLSARSFLLEISRKLAPQPTPADESGQAREAPLRNLPDGATFEDYRNQLAVGNLTPVDQGVFDNLLHDELERLSHPPEPPACGDAVAVSELAALLPGPYYMDPPDGGDVPLIEQLRRMAEDAARWRFVVTTGKLPLRCSAGYYYEDGVLYPTPEAAIDAARLARGGSHVD